jgi:oligopeptide transport system substrate-binding protein
MACGFESRRPHQRGAPLVKPHLLLLALAATVTSCDRRPDKGAVVVSAIGDAPALRDASRRTLAEPDRVLAGATAQGLVSFDAAGVIQPGLAQRWIVIDGGRTYIFRLRRAAWSDGRPVTAREVVAWLKRQLARGSRNPLAPYLTAVEDVVEMTPDVIEVDLSRPRPDLLALFAQPELAILRAPKAIGAGPFRVETPGAAPLLTPLPDPDRATDEQQAITPEDRVRLRGERAALAVTRFVARQSDLVSGGTIADWPLVKAAGPAPNTIRLDPAAGLFGLAVTNRSGLLGTPDGRAAVAAAIDRQALTAAVARDWSPTEQLLPAQLDSAAAPAIAEWVAVSLEDRRTTARALVAAWRQANDGAEARLRLALPAGPGGTLLWGHLAADLLTVGIRPVRVAPDAAADLRLIDAVAPYDSARWYLATACAGCGLDTPPGIEAARFAPSLDARAAALASADAELARDGGYIPIARPFRWSLVSLRLKAWQANARAWHPLNQLRRDPNSTP